MLLTQAGLGHWVVCPIGARWTRETGSRRTARKTIVRTWLAKQMHSVVVVANERTLALESGVIEGAKSAIITRSTLIGVVCYTGKTGSLASKAEITGGDEYVSCIAVTRGCAIIERPVQIRLASQAGSGTITSAAQRKTRRTLPTRVLVVPCHAVTRIAGCIKHPK